MARTRGGARRQAAAPARARDEARVGRRVAKTFGSDVYDGTVTRVFPRRRLWHVAYDDGDAEELDAEELAAAIALYEARQDRNQISVLVDKDDAGARNYGKEGTGIIESSNPSSRRRIPTTKPQSPRAANDTPKLSSTKECGQMTKHKNSTTLIIESSQEAEIEISTAKASTIPDKLSAAQYWENEKSDLLGNLDAVITGTSGDSRNDKRELAAMAMPPELLDEEEDRKPTSSENKPLAARQEDVSLVRKGDTVEVVSKVAGLFGEANMKR